MKYTLGTNVCIRLLKGDFPGMLKHIEKIKNDDVYISAVVRFELYYGACKSSRVEENLKKLNKFFENYDLLPVDQKTADKAGIIRAELEKKGNPIGPYDLLIGATALVNDCILVTHNTREFSRISKLKIEDWEI